MSSTSRAHQFWWLLGLLHILVATVSATETGTVSATQAVTTSTRTKPIVLSPSEETRAARWGLKAIEWQRYRSLMQGIRASISPVTLSPIEVLGIHARDDAERRRYAERWALAMHEDVERILAFQRAYDEAMERLFPREPLIDVMRLPQALDDEALKPEDRVLLFTRPQCPECDVLLERLIGRLDRIGGIDIYLSSIRAGDDQAVRTWAAANGIQPAWVRAGRVTLNFDAGALEALNVGKVERPYLMRRRGESVTTLPASVL